MNVPIKIVAKIFRKDSYWVKAGIIGGLLPIGYATRKGKKVESITEMDSKLGKIKYYVNPKLLYEVTGYVYTKN